MNTEPQLELVRLTGAGARVMIWAYYATMTVLALWSINDVMSPWPTVVGLALFAVVCVVLSLDTADVLTLPSTLFVVIIWPLIALLVSWQLEVPGGHAQWFFGAGTVSLFFIGLRGRGGWAWIGFAALSAVIVLWGATTDVGVPVALMLVAKQLPFPIIATLFAMALRRTGASILRLTAEASARASSEAADLATTAERNRGLSELDTLATPLMTRIVDGTALTAEDRLEFAVAEAGLRDTLRARALSVPAIIAAARQARRRGVDVVLLDDSDPSKVNSADLEAVIAKVSEALAESKDGRIVARLLPPGRRDVATLLVDGSGEERREVVQATPSNDEEPATS